MAERLKARAWRARVPERVPWVRIPLSPPCRDRPGQEIVENADRVVRAIVDRYLEPNKTLRDVRGLMDHDAMNPMREFSNACREELRARGAR